MMFNYQYLYKSAKIPDDALKGDKRPVKPTSF